MKNCLKRYIIKLLFLVAATALVSTGALLNRLPFDGQLLFVLYLANLGTWFLYGFDFRAPFKSGWQRFFIVQLVLAVVLSVQILSYFQFSVLGLILLMGCFYQVELKWKEQRFRAKQIFFFKNLLIGISWAALVILGANNFSDEAVQFMFCFVAIQVGFGSIIRDLNDVGHDLKNGLKTVPVMLGTRQTLLLLHVINLSSLLLLLPFFNSNTSSWILPFSIGVILYKSLLLWQVQLKQQALLWTQYLNILTCLLIFILTYLLH